MAILLSGCISTKVVGVKDPAYNDYQARHIMIATAGMPFNATKLTEDTFEKKLAKYNVQVSKFTTVFPPTRSYTKEKIDNVINKMGIDVYLFIEVVDEKSSNQVVGSYTNTTGTINAYSYYNNHNAYTNGNYQTNSYNIPIVKSTKNTVTKISLVDLSTENIIWTGESYTQANGKMYMQDEDTIQSIVKEVVATLKRSKLIAKN